MNKAIQDQLAPGSTFKIINVVAGLQEGVAQDMRVKLRGRRHLLRALLPLRQAPRMLDIHQAIPLSCDTFFYALAQKLGIDTIAKYATSLGLAPRPESTCRRKSGHHALHAVGDENYHQKYYPGNTISVGIGQG